MKRTSPSTNSETTGEERRPQGREKLPLAQRLSYPSRPKSLILSSRPERHEENCSQEDLSARSGETPREHRLPCSTREFYPDCWHLRLEGKQRFFGERNVSC